MISVTLKEDCCGCSACANICPKGCIEMHADEEGFLYPYVDLSKCVNCGLCEQACPVIHNFYNDSAYYPVGYAAINQNEDIRVASSSGGVFSLLAEKIIIDGGVVFGAALSEDCQTVFHIKADELSEISKLRGSKYIQSSIGDVYIQVRDALEKGRKVLFTGTPCQVEGLHSYLRKEYGNLFCMDFICHGVPSPRVWKKYIEFREKKDGSAIKQAFFRHKEYGWKRFALLFIYTNGTTYVKKHGDDLYMRAFLQNYCLRPSCYHCRFRKLNRISDITVADYWGIYRQYPDIDDDKGVSLVMVHTDKGKTLLQEISTSAKLISVDTRKALEENRAMTESPCMNKARKNFMENLDKMDFDKLVRKYVKEPLNIRGIAKWILRKVNMERFVRNIFKI